MLSFTLHSLLEKLRDGTSPGELDYCLESIVEVRQMFIKVCTSIELQDVFEDWKKSKNPISKISLIFIEIVVRDMEVLDL